MKNIEARRHFWNDPKNRGPLEGHDLIGSIPYPFEEHLYMFKDKDVLEIGPGRGRQYDYLKDIAETYSICDIAPAALAEPIFDQVNGKYLLNDFSDNLYHEFEIIHFWYVIHHIPLKELSSFFCFLRRHLLPHGKILFNTPHLFQPRHDIGDDGMMTTWLTLEDIRNAAGMANFKLEFEEINERSTGHLAIGQYEGPRDNSNISAAS